MIIKVTIIKEELKKASDDELELAMNAIDAVYEYAKTFNKVKEREKLAEAFKEVQEELKKRTKNY